MSQTIIDFAKTKQYYNKYYNNKIELSPKELEEKFNAEIKILKKKYKGIRFLQNRIKIPLGPILCSRIGYCICAGFGSCKYCKSKTPLLIPINNLYIQSDYNGALEMHLKTGIRGDAQHPHAHRNHICYGDTGNNKKYYQYLYRMELTKLIPMMKYLFSTCSESGYTSLEFIKEKLDERERTLARRREARRLKMGKQPIHNSLDSSGSSS